MVFVSRRDMSDLIAKEKKKSLLYLEEARGADRIHCVSDRFNFGPPPPSLIQLRRDCGTTPPTFWGSFRACERLRNQRPTHVVTSNVSTSVKDIWIGNVLLLETFLLKFLPAPEPFQRKDALGWVRVFYIYICRIL